MLCLIQWEQGQAAHQLTQIDLTAEREIQESYGFLPNLEASIHLNARHVLRDTSPDVYFSHFTNTAFHDLTPGKSLPLAAEFLLSFGLMFIPIPKNPCDQMILMKALIALTMTCSWKPNLQEMTKTTNPKRNCKWKAPGSRISSLTRFFHGSVNLNVQWKGNSFLNAESQTWRSSKLEFKKNAITRT